VRRRAGDYGNAIHDQSFDVRHVNRLIPHRSSRFCSDRKPGNASSGQAAQTTKKKCVPVGFHPRTGSLASFDGILVPIDDRGVALIKPLEDITELGRQAVTGLERQQPRRPMFQIQFGQDAGEVICCPSQRANSVQPPACRINRNGRSKGRSDACETVRYACIGGFADEQDNYRLSIFPR